MDLGYILSIRGEVVEVEFYKKPPFIGEILVLEENPKAFLEVHSVSTKNTFCAWLFVSQINYIEVLRLKEQGRAWRHRWEKSF